MFDGKTVVGGYRFLPDKIVGMDELPDNSRKDFVQAASEPTYNWETDMEFLQALPLTNGYTVNVNFYDPAQKPPARYLYSVTGSDKIAEPNGSTIDCWIVSHSFKAEDGSDGSSRFWSRQAKHRCWCAREVKTADGNVLVKTLLNPESGDAGEGTRSVPENRKQSPAPKDSLSNKTKSRHWLGSVRNGRQAVCRVRLCPCTIRSAYAQAMTKLRAAQAIVQFVSEHQYSSA